MLPSYLKWPTPGKGTFLIKTVKNDGFENKVPVKSYPPNGYGLYYMTGNVWEYTQDWFNIKYYEQVTSSEALKKS
jgi:formylglycine-generating enzyme required for sulfatase activity